jgi:hypothetical protein
VRALPLPLACHAKQRFFVIVWSPPTIRVCCAGGSVPEPELSVFEAFHAGVVDSLKGGSGGGDLVARLPELRAAAAGTLGSSGGEGVEEAGV